MAIFTREELYSLLAPQSSPCVSILMPTHRHHPGTEQDPIRFKNLLKQADALLESRAAGDVRGLVDPIAALSDPEFWRYQSDGLAIFRSRELMAHYRIPMKLPERVVVADSFHVKPLLRFLQTNQRFLVLVVSQNQVSLYEGTPYSFSPLDLGDAPANLAEAVGVKRERSPLNVWSPGAGRGAVFYGAGAPEDSREEDRARFFRAIDRAIWEILRNENVPLILAGVERHFPLYREASRYPFLAEEGVSGNFDAAPPDELRARVWPLASEIFRKREEEVLSLYASSTKRRLVVDELSTLARMTVRGRIRWLLVAEDAHVWGTLNRDTGEIAVRASEQDADGDDLLDDLAESVLARGGDVLVLPKARMPGVSPAAAILRW
jgi:hypothetical protein